MGIFPSLNKHPLEAAPLLCLCLISDHVFALISREKAHIPSLKRSHYYP